MPPLSLAAKLRPCRWISASKWYKPSRLLTLITLTLSISGFESPTLACLAGLALRLCSAEPFPPLEIKWLLIRLCRPIRTILTVQFRQCGCNREEGLEAGSLNINDRVDSAVGGSDEACQNPSNQTGQTCFWSFSCRSDNRPWCPDEEYHVKIE